tara:strand:+ start:336 stop:1544 length:1209 start_codon:yes stop_codon:yes gene_type:complete
MKIGITVGIKDYGESLWINGMKLNTIMFAQTLKNSNRNYEVILLQSSKEPKIDQEGMAWDLNEFPTYYYKDKLMECDFLILLGAQLPDVYLTEFKKAGKKIVWYKCGNTYIMHMEDVLFNEPHRKEIWTKQVEHIVDEIWYVPQQHESCGEFFSCLHRTISRPIPFVWHPRWLDVAANQMSKSYKAGQVGYSEDVRYKETGFKKRLSIMEPNLNIVKYSMIPYMIAETSYRGDVGRQYIKYLSISNGMKIAKSREYNGTTSGFDLFKDGKVFAEARYRTAYFLSQQTDILLCHQVLNPLNYLYLDAAHLGYPVLHNAWMCKDIGYYYEGFNIKEGAAMLDKILLEHDKDIEGYNERNKKAMWRYHAENPMIAEMYDQLIDNVINETNIDFGEYDPLKNTYVK